MVNPKPLTVLFVSTQNAVRSILAEALMRHLAGNRFSTRSAGIHASTAVDPQTLSLLENANIPTDSLHSKNIREFWTAAHFFKVDVIVTLSEEARRDCPSWPSNPVRAHWTVDNPLLADHSDMREWKFRKCFATLETRISSLIRSRVAQSASELLLQLKDIGMVV